jgi:carboxypeptidase Taq
MKRAHEDYLQDMLDNAEKAVDFVGSMELDQFFEDEKTSYAVVRALEIIGEAVRLQEVNDLNGAAAVLHWDQATYMPPGGAPARGRQWLPWAARPRKIHRPGEVGKLLDDLQTYAESLPYDDDDASLIRVTRRGYDKATKVPPALLAAFYEHSAAAYQAWTEARPANDFAAVQPYLENPRSQPPTRRLLPRLRPHRRPADRFCPTTA